MVVHTVVVVIVAAKVAVKDVVVTVVVRAEVDHVVAVEDTEKTALEADNLRVVLKGLKISI